MIVVSADCLYTPQEEIQKPLIFIEDGLITAIASRAEQEVPGNATLIDLVL